MENDRRKISKYATKVIGCLKKDLKIPDTNIIETKDQRIRGFKFQLKKQYQNDILEVLTYGFIYTPKNFTRLYPIIADLHTEFLLDSFKKLEAK